MKLTQGTTIFTEDYTNANQCYSNVLINTKGGCFPFSTNLVKGTLNRLNDMLYPIHQRIESFLTSAK